MLQMEGECGVEVGQLLTGAAAATRRMRYCWLVTTAESWAVNARPMGWLPRELDEDDWTFWFITDGRSRKAADMRRVGQASIIFQHDPEDAFIALTGKASLAESKAEIRKRWTAAYDPYFPDGPSSAVFVTIDVARMELWIRGVTPEPFGLRTTVLERDAMRRWQRLTAPGD